MCSNIYVLFALYKKNIDNYQKFILIISLSQGKNITVFWIALFLFIYELIMN